MSAKESVTIGLVGSGGDGVALLGTLIQRLMASQGYCGQMAKYYGAQIRGGGSAVKLSISAKGPVMPGDVLDVLVCLDWNQYAEFGEELKTAPQTNILSEGLPPNGVTIEGHRRDIHFGAICQALGQEKRNKNVVAFGLLTALLGVSDEVVASLVAQDKKFGVIERARAAFERGRAIGQPLVGLVPSLAAPVSSAPKRVLCGNDAVVEATISAGARGCFFYPITPASEISLSLEKRLRRVGGTWRQAECEIAAVMNGLGASLTGVKTIVATSGPGLSLMTEALSFAVGAEIPLVLVDVQRGGPSTGVPTRSEQSDLFHAVFGGHGDAPRVVLAPIDLEGVWRLTREAFNLSEGYQTPVLVLSDQQLGQTYAALDGAFLASEYPVINRLKPTVEPGGSYLRFAEAPNGISPMANIGDPGTVYQTSGLSHGEAGTHKPSYAMLEGWHAKIARKLEPLERRDDLVRLYGNLNSRDRIITWGSSAQAVLAALEWSGLLDSYAVCVPELIAPFPEAAKKFVNGARRLMSIELNHSGQFGRYLGTVTNLPRDHVSYHRSGAQPFGITEVYSAIIRRFCGKEARR